MSFIEYRKKVLLGCENDLEFRKEILQKCKEDIIFFIKVFCWTYDPRKGGNLPFLLYPFQEDFIHWIVDHIDKGEKGVVEKSRDMGATWCFIAVFVHKWLFEEGFFALLGSRKEDYVDKSMDLSTLFERFRFILYKLPWWMMPDKFKRGRHDNFMRIISPVNKNSIVGESANNEFGRAARAKVVLLDEFAFWPSDYESFASVSQVSNCIFILSTPYGERNKFNELAHSSIDKYTLHWKKCGHPDKTDEWYKGLPSFMNADEIAQEIDINYVTSAGKAVYPEFKRDINTMSGYVPGPGEIIRGWDFGFHHPACVFAQIDSDGRLNVFYEVLGNDLQVNDFCLIVRYISGETMAEAHTERIKYMCANRHVEGVQDIAHLKVYSGTEIYRDYCDAAGRQLSDKSNQTSIEILNSHGIKPGYRPARIDEGRNIIRKLLKDGMLLFDLSCVNMVKMVQGGYHYPKDKAGNNEEPEKDGYYDHLADALRYICHLRYSYLMNKDLLISKQQQTPYVENEWLKIVREVKRDMAKLTGVDDYTREINALRERTGGMGY